MKKIIVNARADAVRTLSPFAYKDLIKTLENSNAVRVELDGVMCEKSAVTKGRDVKSNTGMKHHLYFYIGGVREWMPISTEEHRAYSEDPAFRFVITSVVAPVAAEPDTTTASDAGETDIVVTPAEPAAAEPVTRKGRRAQREAAKAEAEAAIAE